MFASEPLLRRRRWRFSPGSLVLGIAVLVSLMSCVRGLESEQLEIAVAAYEHLYEENFKSEKVHVDFGYLQDDAPTSIESAFARKIGAQQDDSRCDPTSQQMCDQPIVVSISSPTIESDRSELDVTFWLGSGPDGTVHYQSYHVLLERSGSEWRVTEVANSWVY